VLGETTLVGVVALLSDVAELVVGLAVDLTGLKVVGRLLGLFDIIAPDGEAVRRLHRRIDQAIGDVDLAIGGRRDEHVVGRIGKCILGSPGQHGVSEAAAGRLVDRQRIEIHHRGPARCRLGVKALVLQRCGDLLRHVLALLAPPVLVGAQPAFEQRLRRDDDMRLRLDILAVGAVLAGRLAVDAELGVEPQPVERAKTFVAF